MLHYLLLIIDNTIAGRDSDKATCVYQLKKSMTTFTSMQGSTKKHIIEVGHAVDLWYSY